MQQPYAILKTNSGSGTTRDRLHLLPVLTNLELTYILPVHQKTESNCHLIGHIAFAARLAFFYINYMPSHESISQAAAGIAFGNIRVFSMAFHENDPVLRQTVCEMQVTSGISKLPPLARLQVVWTAHAVHQISDIKLDLEEPQSETDRDIQHQMGSRYKYNIIHRRILNDYIHLSYFLSSIISASVLFYFVSTSAVSHKY